MIKLKKITFVRIQKKTEQNSYSMILKIKEPVSYNGFCVQGIQGIQGNWSRETFVFLGLIVMYSK